MDDQIIDAAMAQALQADVIRTRPIVGWIVMRDPSDYPDKIIARLVTDRPTPYVLVAGILRNYGRNCQQEWYVWNASHLICLRWWRSGFLSNHS
jgi:hypothetical protein